MILPIFDVKRLLFFILVLTGNSDHRIHVRTVNILLHIFHQLRSHLTSLAEHQSRLIRVGDG